MANTEPSAPSASRYWPAALLVVGLGLLATSFLLPGQSVSRASWSPEQARAYQKASIKLHGLSHEFEHAAGSKDQEALKEKLNQAQAEYGELRSQLDTAIDRPKHVATTLRVIGSLLIAVGAIAIFYKREPFD
jgi:hypothetical protein